MDIIELIGRLLFAGLFLFYAVQHATQFHGYAAFAGSRGTPFPKLAVAVTGVMLAVGGGLVALGLWADLGALISSSSWSRWRSSSTRSGGSRGSSGRASRASF